MQTSFMDGPLTRNSAGGGSSSTPRLDAESTGRAMRHQGLPRVRSRNLCGILMCTSVQRLTFPISTFSTPPPLTVQISAWRDTCDPLLYRSIYAKGDEIGS